MTHLHWSLGTLALPKILVKRKGHNNLYSEAVIVWLLQKSEQLANVIVSWSKMLLVFAVKQRRDDFEDFDSLRKDNNGYKKSHSTEGQ